MLTLYVSVLRSSGGTDAHNTSRASVERWLVASQEAYDAAQYDDALQPTLELTRAFPNQHVYAERLARIYRHLDRAEDEARAWERVVDLSPTPTDACPAMPDAYIRAEGFSDAALDAFERCSTLEPQNADMLFYLARAREQAGRDDLAEASYREVIRIDRNHVGGQLGLARLALKAGRMEEAQHSAELVLQSHSDHTDALLIAGLIAQRRGLMARARQQLTRVLSLAEHYVDAHVALGILDFNEGQIGDARRHFQRAVELDPARRSEVAVWLERAKGRH